MPNLTCYWSKTKMKLLNKDFIRFINIPAADLAIYETVFFQKRLYSISEVERILAY